MHKKNTGKDCDNRDNNNNNNNNNNLFTAFLPSSYTFVKSYKLRKYNYIYYVKKNYLQEKSNYISLKALVTKQLK